MNKHLLPALLLLLLAVLPLRAEYFRHIGLSDGLTQPSVMAIFQDRLERMWFGTREGINRYDGTRVTPFKGWNQWLRALHQRPGPDLCGRHAGDDRRQRKRLPG